MSRNLIYAKVIADSISEAGHRLTSLEMRLHRFVLAELNTHRRLAGRDADGTELAMEEFSRNSASSRAIPAAKQIRRVEQTPALPVVWPAEQKGMQGGEPLHPNQARSAEAAWRNAADDAVIAARRLVALGVHKSLANRVLEPFMMHTVVISATDWQGFWDQRCSPLAQPEIREAAEAMKAAYDASEPTVLREGQWHLPYVDRETITAVEEHLLAQEGQGNYGRQMVTRYLVHVSAARCARTSYETQDGTRDIEADLNLYDRLVTAWPPHWSPLEHPATPWPQNVNDRVLYYTDLDGQPQARTPRGPVVGNFTGWRQMRYEMESPRG